jgi:hypothetical protein
MVNNPAWQEQTISVYPLKKGSLAWSVRTDRYRYTEDGEGVPVELVDYDNDPYEWQNLINESDHAETLAKLKKVIEAHRQKYGNWRSR